MNKENNFPHFGLCTNRELCILCTLHHFAKSLRNYLEQLHNHKTWGLFFDATHTYDHPIYQILTQQLLTKMRKQKRLTTRKSNAGTKC